MTRKTWLLVLACLLAGPFIWQPAVRAQDDDPLAISRGMDVIILVDVSRSMQENYKDKVKKPGSDEHQLRWDAVKLVVDLLSREDRLMVRRFNHGCPPSFEPSVTYTPVAGTDYHADLAKFFKYDSRKDDEDFRRLSAASDRSYFADKVTFFGGQKDHKGFFDFGGTGIITGLKTVAPNMKLGGDGRRKIVILLTDGLDDRYHQFDVKKTLADWATEEQYLRSQLAPFIAAADSDIKSYTFGLNLDLIRELYGPDREDLSRRFLSSIALMNGANFQSIQDSGGLVEEFRSLIWSLKECWIKDDIKAESGEARTIETIVRPDIVDVGILAWERGPESQAPKNTNPPAGGIQTSWPDSVTISKPVVTKGKDDAVYEYAHWEGAAKFGDPTSSTPLFASPFASLSGPVNLSIGLKAAPSFRQMAIAKRTGVRLFRVVRPGNEKSFNRFRRLPLEVSMAAMVKFQPRQFQITAQLFAEGEGRKPPLKEIALKQVGDERRFLAELSLRDVPYNTQDPFTYYSLGFLINGLELDQNPLGGFRLELPRRTIRVDNQLLLKKLADVTLTPDALTATVQVEADGNAEELALYDDVQLPIEFTVPTLKDEPVPAKHFGFEPGTDFTNGMILLRQGRAAFKLGLTGALPPSGEKYEPGRLKIPDVAEFRSQAVESKVNLAIGLFRVAINPDMVELTVAPETVRSPPLDILPLPKEQKRDQIGKLNVTLVAKAADKGTESDVKFEPKELWLEPKGKTLEEDQRQQTLEFDLEQPVPFTIALHTTGKPAGKYMFDLKVEGERITPMSIPVRILVSPPSFTLQSQELTIYAVPGSTHELKLPCKFKSNQSDDQEPIYIQGGGRTAKFAFQDTGTPGKSVSMPLDSPGKESPFIVKSSADDQWNSIPLTLKVPTHEGIPYGRYDAVLNLAGDRVSMQQVKLHVIVNDLRVEWPFEVEGKPDVEWRPITSRRLIQFLEDDEGMTKRLRVRTELNDPIDPKDVQIGFLAPFQDGAKDPQDLPHIVNKRVLKGTQQGVEVDLKFAKVVNFNKPEQRGQEQYQKGLYTVMLQVNAPSVHIPERKTKFTVQYLKQDDLLPE